MNSNLVALVLSTGGEREVETFRQASIIKSSPSGIRQDLVGLLDPDKPLGILLDPTGRGHVRVVHPGELLVGLFDLDQGSGLWYAQKIVKAQSGGLLGHEHIVDCGPEQTGWYPRRRFYEFEGEEIYGGREKSGIRNGYWNRSRGREVEEATLASVYRSQSIATHFFCIYR